MSGQGDAAAERSAHVSRGPDGAWGPSLIVERDGAALLRVTAERDRAVEARNFAVREMADMARQAGSWQGIAEGKDAIIRELEAERDAALAEAARLREAVTRAAAQFDYYEQQHRAKGTADADAKADTNRDMAAMLRAALGETTDGR